MLATCSPVATHVLEPRVLPSSSQKEFVVHGQMVAVVDHPDLREQIPSPERALVAERHAVVPMTDDGERSEARLPNHIVCLIDVEPVREHDVTGRLRYKHLRDLAKRAGEIDVV